MHKGGPNAFDSSQQYITPCNTFHVSQYAWIILFIYIVMCLRVGLNAETSQARSVLLRPRALYFPVQHKTG